jgi:hypothetical protein
MQDPNWFYSALSQCAAAIIGIISAIIINRILMISSEKNGLLNKINELSLRQNLHAFFKTTNNTFKLFLSLKFASKPLD